LGCIDGDPGVHRHRVIILWRRHGPSLVRREVRRKGVGRTVTQGARSPGEVPPGEPEERPPEGQESQSAGNAPTQCRALEAERACRARGPGREEPSPGPIFEAQRRRRIAPGAALGVSEPPRRRQIVKVHERSGRTDHKHQPGQPAPKGRPDTPALRRRPRSSSAASAR
jgi:hypothetical protein